MPVEIERIPDQKPKPPPQAGNITLADFWRGDQHAEDADPERRRLVPQAERERNRARDERGLYYENAQLPCARRRE